MQFIWTTATATGKMRTEAKARSKEHGDSLAHWLDRVAQERGYVHWKHVTDCQANTETRATDLAIVGQPQKGLESKIPPDRKFDHDFQFWAWYQRTRLSAVLLASEAVQRAQQFCSRPCTVFVSDFQGHDQLPSLVEADGSVWYQQHIGQLYPATREGKPCLTGDYIGVVVEMAYSLVQGSAIDLTDSSPNKVTAWASRYDAGMGGVDLSPSFTS